MASHLRTELFLKVLDMGLEQQWPQGLIHHSGQGSQYTSLVSSIIGLLHAEAIRWVGPSRNVEEVKFAILEWRWWFDYHRPLGAIGFLPPAEHKLAHILCQVASIELQALS